MKKLLTILALAMALVLACVTLSIAESSGDAASDGGSAGDANATTSGAVVAWGEWDSVTTVDGHKVSFLGEDYARFVPSTCTSYGTAYYKCEEPSHLNGIHAVTIKKRDHLYNKEGEYVAPTCTEPGKSVQECIWCGKKNEVWEIMPNGHSFTGKSYDVIVAPTCTSVGYGVVTCDVCGVRQVEPPIILDLFKTGSYVFNEDLGLYIDDAKHWVMLQKIAHQYTDWTYIVEATCYYGGEATRTCVACGDIQYVDKDTTLWVDKNGNVKETGNPKKGDVLLKVAAGKIDIVNEPYYKDAKAELESKTWENREDLQKCINKWVKAGAHTTLSSDKELDCYNRILTYVCPYCGSQNVYDSAGHMILETPHKAITVKLLEPSHVFDKKEENMFMGKNPYTWIADYNAEHPLEKVEEFMEKLAYSRKCSINATCEVPGIDLYKCTKWDGNHGFTVDGYKIDGYKAVVAPATGHKWSEWQTTETYTKDGKYYEVQVHICETCGKTEHQTIANDALAPVEPTALEEFVERCYGKALSRLSDPEGFKYWVNKLQTKQQTAQQVAYGFVFSPEMNADRKITDDPEALLKSLYALYLGREPDGGGMEYWLKRIEDGITLEELNDGFAQSVEFQGIVKSFGLE